MSGVAEQYEEVPTRGATLFFYALMLIRAYRTLTSGRRTDIFY